jgi:VWFA-related protein
MSRLVYTSLVLCSLAMASPVSAQSPDPSAFTLHTNVRVVVTDVTVTDSHGNPVSGLSRSAFHIFDNNRPQALASFEEHTGSHTPPTASAPSAPHTFSNDFLLHPPPVFNVIVLDIASIDITDQMYLNQQLTHFIQNLPAKDSLAIYVHLSEVTLLLQNFTPDHDLLLSALHKAMPQLLLPSFYPRERVNGLLQIAAYLGQFPGRKNVLWFSGGASLLLRPDATLLPIDEDLRPVYDQLEASRIALYPIDVRGPGPSLTEMVPLQEEAMATGGRAFYNTNGLADVSSKIIATDANFYTLSYSPQDFKQDNKWHKVTVKVDGGYTLSYRTGYYGDGLNAPAPKTSRTLLTADGEKVHLPENRSEPIIFRAEAQPSSVTTPTSMPSPPPEPSLPKKNETTYTIRYFVPVAAFLQKDTADGQRVQLGAGIIAFNHHGSTVGRLSQKFTLDFHGDRLRDAAEISFDQKINLPRGQNYVSVFVWDMTTGRLGTIQIPLIVERRATSH